MSTPIFKVWDAEQGKYVGIPAIKGPKGDPGASGIVVPEDYGAVGDGVADDTQAIQTAVNIGSVVLFRGTYKVNGHANHIADDDYAAIVARSNSVLWFVPGSKLIVNDGDSKYHTGIFIRECENVVVHGATLEGDKTIAVDDTNQGNGIKIRASSNVMIEDCEASGFLSDGFQITGIGHTTVCDGVTLRNCKSHGNNRQGLSVVGGKNILVDNCEFYDIDGTNPGAGIDLEANYADTPMQNIKIRNSRFWDSRRSIILANGDIDGIVIENCDTENILINKATATIIGGKHYDVIAYTGADGMTVKGAEVWKNITAATGTTVVVDGCYIHGDGTNITLTANGGTMLLRGCRIENAKNINCDNLLKFESCSVLHTIADVFLAHGNVIATNSVFDFSASSKSLPFNATTIELNNCDFYPNGSGECVTGTANTATKNWIGNRFHGDLTYLAYRKNTLINNVFKNQPNIGPASTGLRINNVFNGVLEASNQSV